MIAYDRYTEYLSKQIYKTITPAEHQIAARGYDPYGLTEQKIKLMKENT